MPGRDPGERERSTTPLELLYDLTYVIAFATAAEELAHHIVEGGTAPAVAAYCFAVFAITWAWINFTWFTSAYGNDDVYFRIATIVQMIGVLILTFGLPASFAASADGRNPNDILMVVGYFVMRVPQIALWLRASVHDTHGPRVGRVYAGAIAVAQAGWILAGIVPLPLLATWTLLIALALAEMVAPVVIESRVGRPPWNPGHIAERFGLLTLITLGEVIAATTAAVGALAQDQGWTASAVVLAASGLVLAAALWWAYFLIPSRPILRRWPERTFAWRYAHLPMFGSIAAVGAGLRVAASAVDGGHLSLLGIALCLAVPVACVLATVFLTWSVLMHAYDLTHVPLFVVSLLPLGAAVAVGAVAGPEPLDTGTPADVTGLVVVAVLVAASGVVEVVGHELVGYRHTRRVVERTQSNSSSAVEE